MSRETKNVDAESDSEFQNSVVDLWRKWYDLPVLAVLAAFMLWVRLQGYDRFTRNGQVFFSGNDAYYHYRNVAYTVSHWPFTMDFDPWTYFPYGTSIGQFGTLYDQLMATAALVVGLGSPSDHTVALVTLVTPAVVGALTVVPVYYIGQRLGGRLGGLFGVLVLALLPGTFLQRSLVGFSDHQVAETFFQAFAIAAFVISIGVAERELPVYEQFLDRDWDGLRESLKWSAFAGIAIGLYMWVWPPGVVLLGIIGVFFTVALCIDYVRGRSPEHVAIVGVASMLVTFLMLLVQFDTLAPETTSISSIQLLIPLAIAAGCAFMAGLARVWDQQGFDERYYPVSVGAILAVGAGIFSVVLPGVYDLILTNVTRILLFSQSKSTLTVREAQSVVPQGTGVTIGDQINAINSFMFSEYGLAYVTAYLALIWMIGHLYLRDYRAEDVFVVVYTVFTTLMALTQVRFNYYLVISIAVLNAWLFGQVVDLVGVPSIRDSLEDVEVYQVLALLAVLVIVVAPLAPPLAAASAAQAQQTGKPMDVVTAGKRAGPSGVGWADSGNWMQNNTPAEGEYGGANNRMEYYGSYARTDDYEYPKGAYGVLAWWDYGHWITVFGERIPVANPFQQNPRAVSAFFQAQDEDRAELVLETLPAMKGRAGQYDELSDEKLRDIESGLTDQQDGEDTRYVMIDDASATGKFYAIAQWSGPASQPNTGPQSIYMRGQRYRIGNQSVSVSTYNQRFRDTMMYKLYYQDGSGLEHYRLVHESADYSIVGGLTNGRESVALTSRSFGSGWDGQKANVSRQLQTNRFLGRAVPLGNSGLYVYNAHLESEVKTYERVPGATVTGQVDEPTENTSVAVSVELETHTGRTFSYSQVTEVDEDGNFNVTVPYSTDNAVVTADGGTNESVRATGSYDLLVSNGGRYQPVQNFTVSETAVYDGEEVGIGTVEAPETNTTNQSGRVVGDGTDSPSGSVAGPAVVPTNDAVVPPAEVATMR